MEREWGGVGWRETERELGGGVVGGGGGIEIGERGEGDRNFS